MKSSSKLLSLVAFSLPLTCYIQAASTDDQIPAYSGAVISTINQLNQLNQTNSLRKFACKPSATPKTPLQAPKRHQKQFVMPEWIEAKTKKNKMAQGEMDPCYPRKCETRRWDIYLGALGIAGGEFHTGEDQVGYQYWTGGALVGVDYVARDWGVGVVGSYAKASADVHESWGKFEASDTHISLYGKYAVGSLIFNGIIGGGFNHYHLHRNVFDILFASQITGAPKGNEGDAFLGMEYMIQMGAWQVIPVVSGQYIFTNIHPFRERHGDGENFKFEHQHQNSLRSTLGVKTNYTWIRGVTGVTLQLTANWQREFLFHEREVHATFISSGTSTTFKMPEAGRNVALGGIDLFLNICNKYGIEGSYSFEWNTLFHDHFFYVGIDFRL